MNMLKLTVDRRLKVTGKIIRKYARGKLLDIGCNDKGLSKHLSPEIQYSGIDYPKINLDEDKLPYEKNSFDAVACLEVMEHLKDPTNLIKEIKRVVKPDGIIFISLPNSNHIYYRLKFLIGKPNDELPFGHQTKKHLHFPIREQSIAFIRKHFRIIRIKDIGMTFGLDSLFPRVLSYTTLFVLKKR